MIKKRIFIIQMLARFLLELLFSLFNHPISKQKKKNQIKSHHIVHGPY